MTGVGIVEELWRYPVKSMAGERLAEAFIGFAGVYGDRCAAFMDAAAAPGSPYLTASGKQEMLLYRPVFRHPERAARPPHLAESTSLGPGLTPRNGDPGDLDMDVRTPSGDMIALDDPGLVTLLGRSIDGPGSIRLVRSDRALTDCRPVSLVSTQTTRTVESETGITLDRRRFRANIYVTLTGAEGFAEDRMVGHRVRIGETAVVAVLERDPRCKILSLDPDTAQHNPEVLRTVARNHSACAGVYCAVLVEGVIVQGDALTLLD
jgi:uncharacterized protein